MRPEPDATIETRQRRPLLRWLSVLFFGSLAIGAFFLVEPALREGPYYRVRFDRSPFTYPQVLLLLVPYALALLAWRRGARVPLPWLLGGAVLLHLIVTLAPPPQSQDFYQYLFYGRMQAEYGANPFVTPPNQLWEDGWFSWTRWHDQTTVYGPVWMGVTSLVAAASGDSRALGFVELKLVVLALDVAVMAMIVAATRRRPDPEGAAGWGILAYAWNPLVLLSVPLAGGVDVALAACFVGALLARQRDRPAPATVLLTAAALVKAYAVVGVALHLFLVARERGLRRALWHGTGAVLLGVAAYVPYWQGLRTFSGLWDAADLAGITITGVFRRLIRPVIGAVGPGAGHFAAEVIVQWLVLGLLVAAFVWAARRVRDERTLWVSTVAVLAVSLYVTPWFNYWYLVAPLALVAVLPTNTFTYPVLAFTGSSLIWVTFSPEPLSWLVQLAVRYGPPAVVLRLQRRPAARRRVAEPSTAPDGRRARPSVATQSPAAAPQPVGGGSARSHISVGSEPNEGRIGAD